MRTTLLLALLAAAPLIAGEAIQFTSSGAIVWRDAPASMPAGAKIAVLEGDPRQPGVFTIRLTLPAGSQIAPHSHPRPERVTVLSGRVVVGFGDALDVKNGKAFTAGGFYINQPGSHHWLAIPETSVIQLTCDGPWELNYVK